MHVARLMRLFAVAALPLSWGCVAAGDASASQHTISGQVRDAQSGRGIADAAIEFVSDTLDKADATSASDGSFTLTVDVRGGVAYGHITAKHPDYEQSAARSIYFDGVDHVVVLELRRRASK